MIAISWEITVGFLTLVGAFISVMTVVVKVNGTLTRLDEAVRQLQKALYDQQRQSDDLADTLASHETRITVLEGERSRR